MTTTITVTFADTHDRISTVARLFDIEPASIVEQPGARPLTIMEVVDSPENRTRIKLLGGVLRAHLLSVRVETLYPGSAR